MAHVVMIGHQVPGRTTEPGPAAHSRPAPAPVYFRSRSGWFPHNDQAVAGKTPKVASQSWTTLMSTRW